MESLYLLFFVSATLVDDLSLTDAEKSVHARIMVMT